MTDQPENPPVGRTGALTRTGYAVDTVTVSSGTAAELDAILRERIDPTAEVFAGLPLILDISAVEDLAPVDYPALAETCRSHGMFLVGLSGAVTEERAAALASRGIPVVNSSRYARVRDQNFKPRVITKTLEIKVPVRVEVPVEVKVPQIVRDPEPPVVIRRSLRSGENLQVPGNSVVVFGSVSNGARIIASHHVLVFGDLMGEIYAGSPKNNADPGNPEAFVFCNGHFNPTFVAIAGNYQTADDMERDPLSGMAGVKRERVLVTLKGTRLNYHNADDLSRTLTPV